MVSFTFGMSANAAPKGGGKPTKPAPEPTPTTTISYVALGDSVATGTVTGWSSIISYVTYFHQYLKNYYGSGTNVTLQNLAKDGRQTGGLLESLETDSTTINAVTNADIITISIGGNNLMQAAEIPGFTNIDWVLADKGVYDFNNHWEKIISKIRELNTKGAKIIVTTVYNPYNVSPPRGYEKDIGLHGKTESRLSGEGLEYYDANGVLHVVDGINKVILSNTNLGYAVADVHTAYSTYQPSSMGKITYFYPSLWGYLFRNPHPKAAGQEIITNLHRDAFLKLVSNP